MIVFCIGCQNKEPEKHVNNFEIIDELEPIGLKKDDQYHSIDVDHGYEIYKIAIDNFNKAHGFHSFVTERYYTVTKCLYGSDIDMIVNDFRTDKASAIMQHKSVTENHEQTVYLKNKEFYFSVNGKKMKRSGFPDIVDERYTFLDMKKEYIISVGEKSLHNSKVYEFLLNITESNKAEFFKEYALGRMHPLSGNVYLLMEIDNNSNLKESMLIYTVDNYGSKYLFKSQCVIDDYSAQDISYPKDLETWKDYPVLKEDLDNYF
ncbi:MAG: hypothetical protein HFJ57_07930 [Clostridia bacterium]|nr:hypothetical protein [Clostridia bacterium]